MERVSSTTKIVKKNCKFLSIEVLAVILVIIGVALLCTYKQTAGTEKVVNYTDCLDINEEKCANDKSVPKTYCDCFSIVEILEPMDGQVTLFYELESYDQTSNSNYSASKDDEQLQGKLSLTPSSNCGNYSYIQTPDGKTKPIAPCGAIADSMFNDTFRLSFNSSYLPIIFTGLDGITDEDKAKFHNPAGDLEQAFKNFSKPINWPKNVWERNIWEPQASEAKDIDLNYMAFQNEAFIAWMKTDMKRKPAWRVNHTDRYEHGLPADNYTLRVRYAYPYSLYSGQRKLILSTVHTVEDFARLVSGIVLIVIGILAIIGKVVYNRKTYGEYVHYEIEPINKS